MKIIVVRGTLGGSYPIEAEILGTFTHGYNLKSGAWGMYPDKDGSSEEAVFYRIRKKRCRRHTNINKRDVIAIQEP